MAKAWMDALVSRGIQTEKRIDHLGSIMQGFCDFLGLDANETARMVLFARYHDIGLVALSTKCVLKPGALDDGEYAVIKKHVDAGYRLACECEELKAIADWIQKHHEYWDGSGYPAGLAGENIPIQCRILSLVDAFEAMTTEQYYRHAKSVDEAMEEIEKNLGTQFDPVIGKKFIAFVNDIPEYIYGDIVD